MERRINAFHKRTIDALAFRSSDRTSSLEARLAHLEGRVAAVESSERMSALQMLPARFENHVGAHDRLKDGVATMKLQIQQLMLQDPSLEQPHASLSHAGPGLYMEDLGLQEVPENGYAYEETRDALATRPRISGGLESNVGPAENAEAQAYFQTYVHDSNSRTGLGMLPDVQISKASESSRTEAGIIPNALTFSATLRNTKCAHDLIFVRLSSLEAKLNGLLHDFGGRVSALEEKGAKLLQVEETVQSLWSDHLRERFDAVAESPRDEAHTVASAATGRAHTGFDQHMQDAEHVGNFRASEQHMIQQVENPDAQVTADHLDEGDDVYRLQESIWDCCTIIGHPSVGWSGSVLLAIGACINVAVQVLFCLIVFFNMANKEVEDELVEAARHWRGVVGHDFTYADVSRKASLVAQMCAQDRSVQFSSTQYQTYADYYQYASRDEVLNGQVLCLMATLVWIWWILVDVFSNYRFTQAVFHQQRGHPCIVIRGSEFVITHMGSVQRVCTICLATLPRLATSSILGWVGTKFLAYTSSMGDLVLNAMALTFILGLDELLYHIIVPSRVRCLISRLRPLLVCTRKIKMLDRGGVLGVSITNLLTLAICFCVNSLILEPYVELMQQVNFELCGGNVDFVTTINKANGIVYYFDTRELPTPLQYKSALQKDSVLDLVRGVSSNSSIRTKSWKQISRLHESPITFAASLLACVDHTNDFDVVTSYHGNLDLYYASRPALQAALGHNVSDCSDLSQNDCSPFAATIIRAICPITCGCQDPWKGLMYGTPSFGCPSACQHFFDDALSYQNDCLDRSAHVLNQSLGWRSYLEGVNEVLRSRGTNVKQASKIVGRLAFEGCPYVEELQRILDLCVPDAGAIGRSIRPWCPNICGCTMTNRAECPKGCHCFVGNASEQCGEPSTQFYKMVNWWIDTSLDTHGANRYHSTITTTATTSTTIAHRWGRR